MRDKYRCEARVSLNGASAVKSLGFLLCLTGAEHRQNRLAFAVGAVVGAVPHQTPEDFILGTWRHVGPAKPTSAARTCQFLCCWFDWFACSCQPTAVWYWRLREAATTRVIWQVSAQLLGH